MTVQQDFFGVLFLTTLESILAQSAQAALAQRDQLRQPTTRAQVNRAVSYVALVEQVVELLITPHRDPAISLARLHQLFQTSPTRQRPNRRTPRPPPKAARQLRHLRYRQRLVA